MKKTYYNPEVSIVEFKANDKTSLNALSGWWNKYYCYKSVEKCKFK